MSQVVAEALREIEACQAIVRELRLMLRQARGPEPQPPPRPKRPTLVEETAA